MLDKNKILDIYSDAKKINYMRSIVIDWLLNITLIFKTSYYGFFLAVNMFDRYLTYIKWDLETFRKNAQLLGATCLYTAIRYESNDDSTPASDFEYLGNDTYTTNDVIDMEMKVLFALDFELEVPTTYKFFEIFALRANLEGEDLKIAEYMLVKALLYVKFYDYKFSEIAAGICYIIMNALNLEWSDTLIKFTRYNHINLKNVIRDIKFCLIYKFAGDYELTRLDKEYKEKVKKLFDTRWKIKIGW